jgi:hypothetical protein
MGRTIALAKMKTYERFVIRLGVKARHARQHRQHHPCHRADVQHKQRGDFWRSDEVQCQGPRGEILARQVQSEPLDEDFWIVSTGVV